MDIISSIIGTLHKARISPKLKHVKGHQDNTIEIDNLNIYARLNVQMDVMVKRNSTQICTDPPYSSTTDTHATRNANDLY